MKYTAVLLLFISFSETALAATCTYYRSSNEITCGSVTCRTRSPGWWWSRSKLPAGDYYIGDLGIPASIVSRTGLSFIESDQLEGTGTTTLRSRNWDVVEGLLYTLEATAGGVSQLLMTIVTGV